MKSILVNEKFQKNCSFSGTPTETNHHLVFGRGRRKLSEEDGLKLPVAISTDFSGNVYDPHKDMHNQSTCMALSKMLGQMAYEMNYYRQLAMDMDESVETSEARESFRKRYGESYL